MLKLTSTFVSVHPVIQVPNQLVGAPLGTDVTLECYVEASPKSINYWVRHTGKCSAWKPFYVGLLNKNITTLCHLIAQCVFTERLLNVYML
jgi:hypothetical protein